MIDLTLPLAGVIAFGVLMYVILDGFDLGVGILYPLMPDDPARNVAIASIAPVWDGNETWLILGGAVLFAAFPTAYAVALPAFYLPLMALLVALIFRGTAFEFLQKAQRTRPLWVAAFAGGSTLAAFSQGVLLGALLEGVRVAQVALPGAMGGGSHTVFAGGAFDWLTPFSLLVGLGVVGGYALLGATWLNLKTEGGHREWAQRTARRALLVSLAALAVVSVYTPLKFPHIAERWFGGMHWLPLSPVPIATAIVGFSLWRELGRADSHYPPFILAIGLFLLGYLGINISLWPHIVPPALTIWDAAAPRASQAFVAVALCITLPMVLVYTGYAYWVFRGKVTVESAGEHGYGAHH